MTLPFICVLCTISVNIWEKWGHTSQSQKPSLSTILLKQQLSLLTCYDEQIMNRQRVIAKHQVILCPFGKNNEKDKEIKNPANTEIVIYSSVNSLVPIGGQHQDNASSCGKSIGLQAFHEE